MLTGPQLLAKFKELSDSDATRTELCIATGYTTTSKEGKTKLLWNNLQTALLEANGISMPQSRGGGPRPSFRTQVLSTNRSIVVGKCYVEMLGVDPGTPFDIEVNEDAGEIILSLVDQ
jgi:hypothetical protein